MASRSAIAILTMVLLGAAQTAWAVPCDHPPADVAKFLHSQPRAALLTVGDLDADHRKLWLSGPNANRCPGLALANLEGPAGGRSYILVLKPTAPRKPAKVILLRRLGAALMPESIPVRPGAAPVVWSLGPSVAKSSKAGAQVSISNDSFVIEYIQASAVRYYVSKRRLRQIIVSD